MPQFKKEIPKAKKRLGKLDLKTLHRPAPGTWTETDTQFLGDEMWELRKKALKK